MAFKEVKHKDVKSLNESLITEASEECLSFWNEPSNSSINNCPSTSNAHFMSEVKQKPNPHNSSPWDESKIPKEIVETKSLIESQELGRLLLKDEELSTNEKLHNHNYSHTDVFSNDSFQNSSNDSQCTIKYSIDSNLKSETEEIHTLERTKNVKSVVKFEPECDKPPSRDYNKKCEGAREIFENGSIEESQHLGILAIKDVELTQSGKLGCFSHLDKTASINAGQCPIKKLESESEEVNVVAGSNNEIASPPPPSKAKIRNTKRRAGILYKQITSSKLCKVTSKYFCQTNDNNNESRWIPPRSPYALVQEDLFDNPWQLLVATVFLTKTSAKRALPQLHKFLESYPRPEDVLKANYEDIDEYFKPLGLTTTRSHVIMRFTVEFLEKDWKYPRELYGIGKYGDDSYRMFCINEWRQVSPDDIPLTLYRNWLLENADHLGLN